MSGPFSQEMVECILRGPFQSSPLIVSVQPQGPDEPDKIRICRHLSKSTRNIRSVNSFISKHDFPTCFDTASRVADMVSLFLYSLRTHSVHSYVKRTFFLRSFGQRRFFLRRCLAKVLSWLLCNFQPITFHIILMIPLWQVALAPPGTQACALDIAKFHRTCAVSPDHKAWLVLQGKDNHFYIDHAHPFGASCASSNAGMIANAMVDI